MTHRLYLPPEQLAPAAATNSSAAATNSPAAPNKSNLAASNDAATRIELTPDQSHYLVRVLRSKTGDGILCFDGAGCEYHARVMTSDSRACVLSLGSKSREQPPPGQELALACGWLKGNAMDTVVQKATELGATSICPLVTHRSNTKLDERRQSNKLRHWRQISISASEQCGRLYLPAVHDPQSLAAFLDKRARQPCILLDLDSPTLDVGTEPHALTLLIGPEGGSSDAERQLARNAGARPASLGSSVLRAETVPLAALAAVRQSWRWRV